jgi:hypothetical protein
MAHHPNLRDRTDRGHLTVVILMAAYVVAIAAILAAAMGTTGFAPPPLTGPVPGIT